MARSTDSSSQDEQTAYKEKDAYGRQDVDQLPTVDNELKSDGPVITAKSKGVVGMELLLSRMNVKYLILLYGGFILLSYTLSLGESGLNMGPFSDPMLTAHTGLLQTNTLRELIPPTPLPGSRCTRSYPRSESFEPSSNRSVSLRWPRSPTFLDVSMPTC